ncbi:MAG: MarR family transcriptional regulator [Candidatus Thorarchaeota archaeon]|nr:MAG: MarR family transcriptional regulator [Candidatus Thorarchaeota archaeon]
MTASSVASSKMDDRLRKVRLYTRVGQQESSLQIYSYLMINGKTTAAELRRKTGLSNATVFRSLALLLEAQLVDKEEDPDATDRRYSMHYYITRNIVDVSKKLVTKSLVTFAEMTGKSKTLQAWYQVLEYLPLTLNRFTSQYALDIGCTPVDDDEVEEARFVKMMAFCVDSIDDVKTLLMKVQQFVGEYQALQGKEKRNWKSPLANPVVLSVSVVAPAPETVPCKPTAILRVSEKK